jgi:hypothetical protein
MRDSGEPYVAVCGVGKVYSSPRGDVVALADIDLYQSALILMH